MKSTATTLTGESARAKSADPHKPRRILYFDHTSTMSGGEIALLNLVKNLDRTKYHPVVVLATEGPLRERLRQAKAETHMLPLPERVRLAKKDKLGVKSLFRIGDMLTLAAYTLKLKIWLRRLDVAAIHTNSLKADIIGGVAGRLAGLPVIWHVRDRIASDYLPARVAFTFRWLCRWLPTYVIANSNATLKTLALNTSKAVTVYSGVERRMEVVHDGMNQNAHDDSSEWRSRRQNPVIGMIGRISPWKGQHVFLRAAAIVRKRFPEARFQIVGGALFDEHEYEVQIHQLCESLGLSDSVDFTGFCNDVLPLVSKMSIVVHASTTGEPFGQVILEAMTLAKPVVATNGGGVPEIVVHGETGLLVPMKDVDAMANSIMELLENPARAAIMGRQGLERARDLFTIERTARAVEDVYDKLLYR